jgi:hypothetical protein
MNDDRTARVKLPTIRPGQAQKETSHNEALTLIDLLVQANAISLGTTVPPSAPVAGQNWVIGSTPSGAWAGQAGRLAGWTDGGWRFVEPSEGMMVWINEVSEFAQYSGRAWVLGEVRGARLVVGGNQVVGAQAPAISGAASGATIDVQARIAIDAILSALRGHGLIAP